MRLKIERLVVSEVPCSASASYKAPCPACLNPQVKAARLVMPLPGLQNTARNLALLMLAWGLWLLAGPVGAQTLTPVSQPIAHPWGLAFLNSRQALVTERGGKLWRVNLADGALTQIEGLPGDLQAGGQGGLLDVVVSPDQSIFLCYTAAAVGGRQTAIFKARLNGQALQGQTIYRVEPAADTNYHFGCRLGLGPQGHLFATSGERGQRELVQDPSNGIGAVLRLNQDGSVPADNLFYPSAVYSYGHRNPQGLAVHPATGQVWVTEHGPKGGDELNALVAGGNYGWPLVSFGDEYRGGKVGTGKTELAGGEAPRWYWTPSIAPSGLAFDNHGALYVGALKYQLLLKMSLDAAGHVTQQKIVFQGDIGRVRDVRIGPDERLYLLNDARNGRLWRLEP